MIADLKLLAAVHHRLAEESRELHDAVITRDPVRILDEIVDVMFYTRELAKAAGLTQECVDRYAGLKSALRDSGVRCKTLEARLATELVSELT